MSISEARFEAVMREHSDMITRICLVRTGNLHDAQDCYQNTMLKCFLRLPEGADAAYTKAWLIRVAINECNSLLRSGWRRHEVCMEEITQVYPEIPDHGALYHVLQLDPKYRDVICLYYYEGYSQREIASILRIPENTVKTRMARAKKQLRGVLGGTEYDESQP